MISADQIMPLRLDASPSFSKQWSEELEQDPIHLNDDGTRLWYLDASYFAVHLIGLFKTQNLGEIEGAFAVIERLHLEGDPYVRELATIGYLESLQNHAGHDDQIDAADFEPLSYPPTTDAPDHPVWAISPSSDCARYRHIGAWFCGGRC